MSPIVSTIHQSRPGRAVRSAGSIFDNFTPNLPSGMTLFTDTSFGNLSGSINADGLAIVNDSANVSFANVSDPSLPFGPSATDIQMDAGSVVGNGTILFSNGVQNWKRVYWSWSLWLSPNYSMHSNGEKFFYPFIKQQAGDIPQSNDPSVSSPFVQWWLLPGETPNGDAISWITGNQLGGGDFQQVIQPAGNSGKIRKGTPQLIEGFMQLNTPGNADGIVRVWCNRDIALDVTNMRLAPASATGSLYINGVRFTSTRGGGTSNTPIPEGGQVRRLDRLAFYGSTEF